MRWILFSAMALGVTLVVACGNDIETPEGAAAEVTELMDEMASVLEGVDDAGDVDGAKEELKELAKRMKAVHDSYEKMSKDDKKAFEKEAREAGKGTEKRFKAAMKDKSPEVQMKLGMALMEAMSEAGGGTNWLK